MPKVHITRDQALNEVFLRNIRARLAWMDKTCHADTGSIVHVCASTWGSRLKHPGDFRLSELRLLFDRTEFTNSEILEVFGRKMEETK